MAKDKRNLKRIEQEGLINLAESLSPALMQSLQFAGYSPEDEYPSNISESIKTRIINGILGIGAGEAQYGVEKLLKDLKEENIIAYIENLPEKVITGGVVDYLPKGARGRYSPGVTPGVADTAFVYRSPYQLSYSKENPDSLFIDKGKMMKTLEHELFLHGAGGRHSDLANFYYPPESTFAGEQEDFDILVDMLEKYIASKGPIKAKKLTNFLNLENEDIEAYKNADDYFREDISERSILSKILNSTQIYPYRAPSPRH
jgi:hypothetical protein